MKECAINQVKRKRCLECRTLFIPNSRKHIFCNPKCGTKNNHKINHGETKK